MIDHVLKLVLIGLVAWLAVSMHRMANAPGLGQTVKIAGPIEIVTPDDLSVRGQMIIDIDRMPFDSGDAVPVKLENSLPFNIRLDR